MLQRDSAYRADNEIVSYAYDQPADKNDVRRPVRLFWLRNGIDWVISYAVPVYGSNNVDIIPVEKDQPTTLPLITDPWWTYAHVLLITGICTVIAEIMSPYLAALNLCLIYLVGVVVVSVRYGRGPSILASILSVAAFDFFFIPPFYSFAVSDSQYLLTFGVMLLVALTISSLTLRLKQHAQIAHERERRTFTLYSMSREFANSQGVENLLRVAIQHITEVFNAQVTVLLPDTHGHLTVQPIENSVALRGAQEEGVAQWVYDHGQPAGIGTNTLPGAKGLYWPLVSPHSTAAGVLGLYPKAPGQSFAPDQLHLLETFANQTAVAIERAQLAEETENVRLQIETERLRNSLLSSVSHDLRTPLASITGAVSTLLENEATLTLAERHELAQIAFEEAERLNRLVGNLLYMTRLESGGVHVEKEWQPLDEVIGTALSRVEHHMDTHPITTHLAPDLPLVPIDGVLVEQVLINLLENAVRYTPVGTPIELSANADHNQVIIEVADHGPGLAPGDEQRVFEKFYRAQPQVTGGVGLGLAICKGIVEAHRGHISAANRPGGGAVFSFTLPLEGTPPEVMSNDD